MSILHNHLSSQHLRSLDRLNRYQAPSTHVINGRRISPGTEVIEFLTGGKAYFDPTDGENRTEIGAGSILWHLPGNKTVHHADPADPYQCVVFHFRTRPGHPVRRQVPRLTVWRDSEGVRSFAWEMLGAFHNGSFDPEGLMRYAYHALQWRAHVLSAEAPNTALPKALQRAMQFMDEHIEDSISIEDIAEDADVSPSHLHHLFSQHLRTSPHKFLVRQRMNTARELLVASDIPIKDLCYRCGFRDVANFGRLFKQRFKFTPSQYRKMQTTLDPDQVNI